MTMTTAYLLIVVVFLVIVAFLFWYYARQFARRDGRSFHRTRLRFIEIRKHLHQTKITMYTRTKERLQTRMLESDDFLSEVAAELVDSRFAAYVKGALLGAVLTTVAFVYLMGVLG